MCLEKYIDFYSKIELNLLPVYTEIISVKLGILMDAELNAIS